MMQTVILYRTINDDGAVTVSLVKLKKYDSIRYVPNIIRWEAQE